MSAWALLVLTAILLMLPWISEKGVTPLEHAPANPEIRGFLRLMAAPQHTVLLGVASTG